MLEKDIVEADQYYQSKGFKFKFVEELGRNGGEEGGKKK
jgi:hypothetical protein